MCKRKNDYIWPHPMMDDGAQEIKKLQSHCWASAQLNWNTGKRLLAYKHTTAMQKNKEHSGMTNTNSYLFSFFPVKWKTESHIGRRTWVPEDGVEVWSVAPSAETNSTFQNPHFGVSRISLSCSSTWQSQKFILIASCHVCPIQTDITQLNHSISYSVTLL